jgi:methyl-accepting chemotaxis protein
MELFTTSKDLVNLALAIGVIGISAAIVYFFISAAGFIKEMRQTIDEINRQLENINQITESVKNKITYMFSYWAVLEKLANKAISLVQKNLINKVKDKLDRYTSSASSMESDSVADDSPKNQPKRRPARRGNK